MGDHRGLLSRAEGCWTYDARDRMPRSSRLPVHAIIVVAGNATDHVTWRKVNAGHVSLGQLKVMSAIEHCRSAALGGHVERCEDCGHSRIAYNSCRNRHC